MKLLLILILLILNKIANGEWHSAVIKRVITDSESVFSDRLDVAGENTMTFCYQEEFERCFTTYYGGEMAGFSVYKITERHAIGMEKKALGWVMIFHNITSKYECLNYPWLTEKKWAILSGGEWYIDDTEPIINKPGYYIP